MKNLKRQNANLIMALVIVGLIAIALLVALASEKYNTNCDSQKNESYALGYVQGIVDWNNEVVNKVNTDKTIPYIYNGTYYELNINQMCEDGN